MVKPLLDDEPVIPPQGSEPEKKKAEEAIGTYNGKKIKLKMLFVESFTLYAADMQRKVIETDDDDRPRELAKEERADRLER